MQHSGIIRQSIQRLSARLARTQSVEVLSEASSFQQDEELLMLHHLLPWPTADVTAGRATPFTFFIDHPACSRLTQDW
jgi:hypothetical protein